MEKDARRREKESESRGHNRAGAVSNLGPNFHSKNACFWLSVPLCYSILSFSHSSSSIIMDLPKDSESAECKKHQSSRHVHLHSPRLLYDAFDGISSSQVTYAKDDAIYLCEWLPSYTEADFI